MQLSFKICNNWNKMFAMWIKRKSCGHWFFCSTKKSCLSINVHNFLKSFRKQCLHAYNFVLTTLIKRLVDAHLCTDFLGGQLLSYELKFDIHKDLSFRWGDIALVVTLYNLEVKILGLFSSWIIAQSEICFLPLKSGQPNYLIW